MATLLPLQTPKTPIRRLATVEDLYRAYEQLEPGSTTRMELINGEIIIMMPPGAPHSGFTGKASRQLSRMIPDTFFVRCQLPIKVSRHSMPQPDVAVVEARKDDCSLSHPNPDEVLLIVEISDSSLEDDLNRKRLLYAKAGIPEYWVVDVSTRQLHVFSKPWEEDYTEHKCLSAEDGLSCQAIGLAEMKVSDLYPEVG